MRRWALISAALLAACCGGKGPAYEAAPAVEISVTEVSYTTAALQVRSINTDGVYVLCTRAAAAAPAAEAVRAEGISVPDGNVLLEDLSPGTDYCAWAVGTLGQTVSKVERALFTTRMGTLPAFADLTLCTGGGRPNSNAWFTIPFGWDEARFAPHVSYADDDGEHWLFDAFLAITGVDPEGRTFCINANGAESADKASWDALASYWLDPGGAFEALDRQIAAVEARIGPPKRKRQVIMMMPDPVMFRRFSDKNSSTTYWGVLDGNQLDFSRIDDQIRALKWYIDRCREKFAALAPAHLAFAGFYILSEELVADPSGWNYDQKRWDRILPKVSDYCHAADQGLYWIPYRGADGCTLWKELGIDRAWLQPNYYWDGTSAKAIPDACALMKQYGMGMELEFEYSMVGETMSIPGIMGPDGAGRYVFYPKDVPALRARLREYMDGYKAAGLYGKSPLALYSGSNALYQLGTSRDPDDIAMYRELCRYITQSPLKQ